MTAAPLSPARPKRLRHKDQTGTTRRSFGGLAQQGACWLPRSLSCIASWPHVQARTSSSQSRTARLRSERFIISQ